VFHLKLNQYYYMKTLTHKPTKPITILNSFSRMPLLQVMNCLRQLSRYRYACYKGERRYSSYTFLTSALDCGEWSASRPGCALPTGKDLSTHWRRRLGGSQSGSGLNTEARGKILCICPGSNSGSSSLLSDTILIELIGTAVISTVLSLDEHLIP
jgi:hypothetical protein